MQNQVLHFAYLATHYTVLQNPPWRLRIDNANPELINCYQKFRCSSCAFISAFNPQSKMQPYSVNQLAQHQLIRMVESNGWNWLSGSAKAIDGTWPAEDNLLIMGITLAESYCLAKKLNQKAFIFCDQNTIARLIYTDDQT
ncbi:DUF3293 domain-containing protein [Neptunicella marina]|uniref:DUF3293 domain-containing protein n=1 Tax=Neptunicella marina TaxID=2125989 RepID=A0A8J6IVF7_9ALTE|nr:DUF3293 domain-containing protein [Neptunicella marina]MBC3766954.1 DUF3293 domain-containing protein [Neptunicella marina]